MKPVLPVPVAVPVLPAAFGRLCVETEVEKKAKEMGVPAAFGRLCVETDGFFRGFIADPAAFGRLCVETVFRKYRSR